MFHFHFFPIASILLELCHIIRHRDYGFSSFFFFRDYGFSIKDSEQ